MTLPNLASYLTPYFTKLTRREFISRISIAALAANPLLGSLGCSRSSPYPQPGPGDTYCSRGYELPQSQSAEQLAAFLGSEHLDSHLDGWFFFGDLVQGTEAIPSLANTGTFFMAMQRIEIDAGLGVPVPFFPSIVAFNSNSTDGYIYGAFPAVDLAIFGVEVKENPWSVTVNWFGQVMSMALAAGQMGMPGATYRLFADLLDFKNRNIHTEVLLCDRLGAVNQGYGTASFFPQFLTAEQRIIIMNSFGGSVPAYLAASSDLMICQGSFYYSLPLLDVIDFTIKYEGATLGSGNRGTMWMDYVVQTYDAQAKEVLIDKATWQFFAIMFPQADMAMMVIQIDSATGSFPVASLFTSAEERARNASLKAAHSWDIDEINIQGMGEKWDSPKTRQQYYMQYRIRLASATLPGDLVISMLRQDQEIVIPNLDPKKPDTIKYEGEASVEGTIGSQVVRGIVFLEVQPAGHQ